METTKTKIVETKTVIRFSAMEVCDMILGYAKDKWGFDDCGIEFDFDSYGMESCTLTIRERTEEEFDVPK